MREGVSFLLHQKKIKSFELCNVDLLLLFEICYNLTNEGGSRMLGSPWLRMREGD